MQLRVYCYPAPIQSYCQFECKIQIYVHSQSLLRYQWFVLNNSLIEKFVFFIGFGTLDFEIIWKESLNVLTITLLRARNLRSCDSNGLSDPYVKLHLVPGVAKVI